MRSSFKAGGASNRKFEHVALLNQWSESLVQVGMQDWHVPRCNNDDPFTDGRMDGEGGGMKDPRILITSL